MRESRSQGEGKQSERIKIENWLGRKTSLKPTMEILTKLQENSKKHHDEVFTRLYRYLLRPDIYSIAYQHLYSNEGAGTKGVDDDT